jgi:hypothetical protein
MKLLRFILTSLVIFCSLLILSTHVWGGVSNGIKVGVYHKSGDPIYSYLSNNSKRDIQEIRLSKQKDSPIKVSAGEIDLKNGDEVGISCPFSAQSPEYVKGKQLVSINEFCKSRINVTLTVPKSSYSNQSWDMNIPYLISPRRTKIFTGTDFKIKWKSVANADYYEVILWEFGMYKQKKKLYSKVYKVDSAELKAAQTYGFDTLHVTSKEFGPENYRAGRTYLIEVKAVFKDGKFTSSNSDGTSEALPVQGISGIGFIVEAGNEASPEKLDSLFHNSSAIDAYEQISRTGDSYIPHTLLSDLYSRSGLYWLAEKAHISSIELAKDSVTKDTLCHERTIERLCKS